MVRRLGVLAVMLLVIGLFVWAGIHNLRDRRRVMQQGIVLVKDGQEAASMAGSMGDMPGMGANLRGKTAPSFTLQDINGKKVSLKDYKGRPVIINFWATYCLPCKEEMPWFEEFAGRYKDQGLVVLGVDQDEDMPTAQVALAAKRTGVTYPILMPDKHIAKTYELGDYLPETFYVSKDGSIVEQSIGTPTKDEMEANIRKAIDAGGM